MSTAFRNMLLVSGAAVAISGIGPRERDTWWLEISPILAAAPLFWVFTRRWPLTPLVYGLVAFHAIVLCVGGHYTYAEVPIGHWVKDAFGLSRNPYDGLGHLLQGVTPCMILREHFLRRGVLRRDAWMGPILVGLCLGFSAAYELAEWQAAELLGGAEAFLGTQGDVWDTQKDMAWAGLGAALAFILLSRAQDRQMERMDHPVRATDTE